MPTENIQYRKLEQIDIPRMAELRKIQLGEEGSTENPDITENLKKYFETHMEDGTFIGLVATCNGEIIATSGMSFFEKPPYYSNPTGKIGVLSCMYTVGGYRRQGIAKKLIELITNEAKELGYNVVQITASRQGALLYKDCGFERKNNFYQLVLA